MTLSSYPTLHSKPLNWSIAHSSNIKRGIEQFYPGDFIVTHGNSNIDRLIQLFTHSHYNHAAVVTNSNGSLLQSESTGIAYGHVSDYSDYYLVHIEVPDSNRQSALDFANDIVTKGDKYGFLTYPTLILRAMTGSKLIIERDGTDFCSEFVGRTLEHEGIVLPIRPALTFPSDLYNWFVLGKRG